MAGTLFFTAIDDAHGRELWKTDGSTEGTVLVKDIWPGGMSSNPRQLTAFGDTLLFKADDGLFGQELWRSDGTNDGTRRVMDIRPGAEGSDPRELTVIELARGGEVLFFSAAEERIDYELWRSDGTRAGTRRVADIWRGRRGSHPRDLLEFDGRLFFVAATPTLRQIWHSDGTAGGTRPLLADAQALGAYSPHSATVVGDALFFVGLYSRLWVTDGTAAGTSLVTGGGHYEPNFLTNLVGAHGLLYFSADVIQPGLPGPGRELWRSDGTAAGTVQVADINPGPGGSHPSSLTPTEGDLFFMAARPDTGEGLWRTDGSEQGTVQVAAPLEARDLVWHDGRLYFQGGPRRDEYDLWTSDGTTAGTRVAVSLRTRPSFPEPLRLTFFDGRLFFVSNVADSGPEDLELLSSDGTQEGTRVVRNIRTATQPSLLSSRAASAGGELFFTANDGRHGQELWRSDGTAAGTRLVRDIQPGEQGSHPESLAQARGLMFFSADDPERGKELWRTDGTAERTRLVGDLRDGPEPSSPSSATAIGDLLFFNADDGLIGREVWRSDGTRPGTWPLGDLNPTGDSVSYYSLTRFEEVRGQGCFRANDSEAWGLLWCSDGTEAGTRRLSGFSRTAALRELGGELYFAGAGPDGARALWRSDTTPAGTRRVTYNEYPEGPYSIRELERVGQRLFFSADSGGFPGGTGQEPWTSDGTEAGTVALGDLWPGSFGSRPRYFTDVDERAVFRAGRHLWVSDGTAESTQQLGPASLPVYNDERLVAAEGLALFTRVREETGEELWQTDGTRGGTRLLADVNVGQRSSGPSFLGRAGDRFFFAASASSGDRELWAYRPLSLVAADRALFVAHPSDPDGQALAVLSENGERVDLLDPASGERLSGLWLFDAGWHVLGMVAIHQPVPAIAALGRHRQSGRIEARMHLLRGTETGPASTFTIEFGGDFRPQAFAALAATADGSADGLVVAGRRLVDWRGVVETRRPTGELLFRTLLPPGTSSVDLETLSDVDGDGVQDIALLGRRSAGRGRLFVIEGSAGVVVGDFDLPQGSDPVALSSLAHLSLTPAPELAVLLRERQTGATVVLVYDAGSGEIAGSASLGRRLEPLTMAAMSGLPGGGREPLFVFGRATDGGLELRRVSPLSSGGGPSRISFPAHLLPYALTATAGTDGAPRLAIVGWSPINGVLRVQHREAETGGLLADFRIPRPRMR